HQEPPDPVLYVLRLVLHTAREGEPRPRNPLRPPLHRTTAGRSTRRRGTLLTVRRGGRLSRRNTELLLTVRRGVLVTAIARTDIVRRVAVLNFLPVPVALDHLAVLLSRGPCRAVAVLLRGDTGVVASRGLFRLLPFRFPMPTHLERDLEIHRVARHDCQRAGLVHQMFVLARIEK